MTLTPTDAFLAVHEFVVDERDMERWWERSTYALSVLAQRPGNLGAEAARNPDEPHRWIWLTRWETVGAFRRALGSAQAKEWVVPVLYEASQHSATFEVLLRAAGSDVQEFSSDRQWGGRAET